MNDAEKKAASKLASRRGIHMSPASVRPRGDVYKLIKESWRKFRGRL